MSKASAGPILEDYKASFVQFLIDSKAVTFGDFVTKSGRETPYFVNMGSFNSGRLINELAKFYAMHIVRTGLSSKTTVLFGPAYKGVPLAVSASIALLREHGVDLAFSFDRKEIKDHGDKGKLVGHQLKDGDRVLIIEDVITAGTTLREIVPVLRAAAIVEVVGVVVAVDRCERGTGDRSATQEVYDQLGLPIYPIITVYDLLALLPQEIIGASTIRQRIASYLSLYGVQQ